MLNQKPPSLDVQLLNDRVVHGIDLAKSSSVVRSALRTSCAAKFWMHKLLDQRDYVNEVWEISDKD